MTKTESKQTLIGKSKAVVTKVVQNGVIKTCFRATLFLLGSWALFPLPMRIAA